MEELIKALIDNYLIGYDYILLVPLLWGGNWSGIRRRYRDFSYGLRRSGSRDSYLWNRGKYDREHPTTSR